MGARSARSTGRNKAIGMGLAAASVCGLLVTIPQSSQTAAAATPFLASIVSGRAPVKDSTGKVWVAQPGNFVGGRTGVSRQKVTGPYGSALLQHQIVGTSGYRLLVPKNAVYQVTILAAETGGLSAGQRRYAITAEGRPTVSNVDIVARVGRNRATAITFNVKVTDGQLNLNFTPIKGSTLMSAIRVKEVVPAATTTVPTPVPATGSNRLAVKLAPNNAWTMSVRNAPVASNSAPVVKNLAGQVSSYWGGVAAFNVSQYNVSFYKVAPNTRRITVAFYDCQGKGYTPDGLFNGAKQFVNVPVPAGAVAATGNDKEMTIYDPAADKLWEFWQMTKTGSGWKACWGGRIDNVSANRGYFPSYFGTAAAGTIMASGMITIDDIKRGRINHAMYLVAVNTRSGAYSWPAQRTDGATNNSSVVMEGNRLRLDPRINVNNLNLTPIAKMVAKAAQEYGFIVCDKGGAVGVITESGAPTKAATGKDPWSALLGGTPEYAQMKNFPWSSLQLLPTHHGR